MAKNRASPGTIRAPWFRILYGGSVKPGNACQILDTPGVDGVLIGGASLLASDFVAIVAVARGQAWVANA
jgi:triosephosphate isomerase